MAIIGADNRVQVTDTVNSAYRAVVEIEMTFPDGYTAQGSGVMIGRNDVLTAGHVVYSAEHGGYATAIYVTAAADLAATPYGVAQAVSNVAAAQWVASGDFSYDLGVITLDRNLGDYTGWYQVETGGSASMYRGTQIVTVGYPGDKPDYSEWRVAGPVDISTLRTLDFTTVVDVYPGQSGSPIFVERDGHLVVIGVISNSNGIQNEAIRINAEFAGVLAAQVAGDAPSAWPVSSADAGATIATASLQAIGTTASGTTGTNTDTADFFRIVPTTSGAYTIDLTGLGNNLDLVLVDASGTVLGQSHHIGNTDERITATLTAGATYYVEVLPVSGGLSGYNMDITRGTLTSITPNAASGMSGTTGSDTLQTVAGSQIVSAGGGDDRILMTDGSKEVDGGAGRDVAVFSGRLADFTVQVTGAGQVQVVTAMGVPTATQTIADVLSNVEYLQFSDKVLFTLGSSDAAVARLYSSALGRQPDIAGLDVQVSAVNGGLSLAALADNFVASAEFQNKYGSLSDQQFVQLLYQQALGRSGEAAGISFWTGFLSQGHDRGDVLVGFAGSPEQVARSAEWLLVV